MNLRVLGWAGFIFLAAGIILFLFGGERWRPYGCGALLTAVTIYGVGLFLVIRMVARMRRAA
ncbi:MAG TPA: hypothetical protein VJU16_04670, partial [Planctomycetota bacterium]|nr:hypothetical protein [Planctomycetota bacterium]